MPCSRGGQGLGVPSSSLARGSSDQSYQRQRVHTEELAEGRSGGLLSGGDAHSVWLRDLANIVGSRGHSRWCPAYAESEPALLNTTAVTRQQCSVSFRRQPTNDLTSPPVDLWGAGPRWGMCPGCRPSIVCIQECMYLNSFMFSKDWHHLAYTSMSLDVMQLDHFPVRLIVSGPIKRRGLQ